MQVSHAGRLWINQELDPLRIWLCEYLLHHLKTVFLSRLTTLLTQIT